MGQLVPLYTTAVGSAGADAAGGALVAAIKSQWAETAAVELDSKTRVNAAPEVGPLYKLISLDP
jgi:hypothetical protein